MATYKGLFRPKNISKYKGDPTKIEYRSRWELVLMRELDRNPGVLEWGSETIIIPYRSPFDSKIHRYFVDFYVKKKNFSDGKIVEVLIEVKPKKQTQPPKVQMTPKTQKMSKSYLWEVKSWGTNKAKWDAAEIYCKNRGWEFIIMTEDDLGLFF